MVIKIQSPPKRSSTYSCRLNDIYGVVFRHPKFQADFLISERLDMSHDQNSGFSLVYFTILSISLVGLEYPNFKKLRKVYRG